MSSFVIFVYIATVKPFRSEILNMIEVFNECVVFLLSYFCIMFTDFGPDLELKSTLGSYYVGIIFATIIINIIVILIQTFFLKKLEEKKH